MQSEPTLFDVLTDAEKKMRLAIHTALPGRVAGFDAEHNTVTVEPMILQTLSDGQTAELPPLADVPIQFPRGGGFVLTFPVAVGDEGLIVFNERCIDGWWASGNKSAPLDARLHDYSDAVFIPGIASLNNVIKPIFNEGLSLQTADGATFIRLTAGKILIQGDIEHQGNSKQTGNHEQAGNWSQTRGESNATGTLRAGKIIGGGVDLETHRHSGVSTGSGTSGGPV